MTDLAAILDQLDDIRVQTLLRLDGLNQDELDFVPSAGPGESLEARWSLGEIFMHLALDEHYLREHIARPLLEGVQPPAGVSFLPPPPPYGTPKDVILFWFDRARTLTRRLVESLPANANLALKHSGGLKPMNGLEWLEAYGGHEEFHHRQIDALIALVAEMAEPAYA
jgi:hypothetical protein